MGQVAIPLVVGSTVIGAMGAINEGEQAQRIAEMKARQAMSVSSRKAYEERRKGDIVVSNARAAMAAGGGVTTDSGAIDTLSGIEDITQYNSFQRCTKVDLRQMLLCMKVR